MSRLPRIIVTGVAHHVTQRGNRRQRVFLVEPDAELEAALMKGQGIGRPLMNDQELLALELRLGRPIRPGKRGRLYLRNRRV
jgi:hypothetical protein